MHDSEDPDLGPSNLEHHAIVAHSKLPIPLQSSFQGRAMLLGGRGEASCNSMCNAALDIEGEWWQVLFNHLRMVEESKGHSAPRALQVRPRLGVRHRLLAIEGAFPLRGKVGQDEILLDLKRCLEEIPRLQ